MTHRTPNAVLPPCWILFLLLRPGNVPFFSACVVCLSFCPCPCLGGLLSSNLDESPWTPHIAWPLLAGLTCWSQHLVTSLDSWHPCALSALLNAPLIPTSPGLQARPSGLALHPGPSRAAPKCLCWTHLLSCLGSSEFSVIILCPHITHEKWPQEEQTVEQEYYIHFADS